MQQRDAGVIILMDKLKQPKTMIGKMPLPEFHEVLKFYSDPKGYINGIDEKRIVEDLEEAKKITLQTMAKARAKRANKQKEE